MQSSDSSRPLIHPILDALQVITELTSETITDTMIRFLLNDSPSIVQSGMALTCAEALRHADVARQRKARQACADEINDRAWRWLRRTSQKKQHPRVPDSYATYAEFLGVQRARGSEEPHEPALRPMVEVLDINRPGDAPNPPLCWSCNASFDFDDESKVVPTCDGNVTVHASCVDELVRDGTVQWDCVDAVAEAARVADDGADEWDQETMELDDEDQ